MFRWYRFVHHCGGWSGPYDYRYKLETGRLSGMFRPVELANARWSGLYLNPIVSADLPKAHFDVVP